MVDDKIKELKEISQKVIEHTFLSGSKNDANDNPYHCAFEIIDLIEWLAEEIDDHKKIANLVLLDQEWPDGTQIEIKKYFDLPY